MGVKVSVLIPSFNHARFLPECIESVRAQTFQDWEIVAVDDGSTDESVSILRSLDDPRVRVFQNEVNLGTYGTLDRALNESSGEFVAVLNSDDVWMVNKLEKQVQVLDSNTYLEFAYCMGFRADETGSRIYGAQPDDWPDDEVQEALPRLLEKNEVLASSVMFRRNSAHFRPELRYSGDWMALLDCALTSPIGFASQTVSWWRMHDHNTFRRSPGQVLEEVLVRESILSNYKLWKVDRIPRDQIRRGLSACARHLSALYILQGRAAEARRVARLAVRLDLNRQTVRRLAVVSLPLPRAMAMLWGAVTPIPKGPERPLLSFS